MGSKAQYQTKQRDELLAYIKSMPGQHITVNDVCEHFKQEGRPIGTATVYRQMEKMVDLGIVAKYAITPGSPACFEYVGEENHREEICYHCKCEICGKLVHMHCDELPQVQEHIREHHGFTINPTRTVFYGVCESCAAKD